MSVRTSILRIPPSQRSTTDPFAAILPEVAEPKLDDRMDDEGDERPVPLRKCATVQATRRWSFRRLLGF